MIGLSVFHIHNQSLKMSNSEKLCVQWNEFQSVIGSAFADLREDKDFTDVTLACEDGKQIEVHKLVLVSSSPFFKDLLKKAKHPHPLIYMKGVKTENLMAMLEFFYFGEANVYQENFDAFLALADELRLKGLNGPVPGNQYEDMGNRRPSRQGHRPEDTEKRRPSGQYSDQRIAEKSLSGLKSSKTFVRDGEKQSRSLSENYALALNEGDRLKQLNDEIETMITSTQQDVIRNGQYCGKLWACKVCGKEGLRTTIRNHVEAKHITGVSHTCRICGKVVKTKNTLAWHMSRIHRK